MNSADKPVPLPDSSTQGYWNALKTSGRLSIQWCDACRRFQHFPEVACRTCGSSELAYRPVSGKGVVYSFVTTHHAAVAGFGGSVPYVIAWIELPEQTGLRVLTNIVNCDVRDVRVGMQVSLTLEKRGGFVLPQFQPS